MSASVDGIVDRLLDAQAAREQIPPLTATDAAFDVPAAYRVLAGISARRRAAGWRAVGRKMGFTNSRIWPRYGVSQPMWAPVWDRTVRFVADAGVVRVDAMTEPRIEPEVVFKLRAPVPPDADAVRALECVDWLAAGFEFVQSPFPGWKFAAADCTAAFGLHAALIVGEPREIRAADRVALAEALATFSLALSCDGVIVDRGVGANVLGSPVLALSYLARLLATQPLAPPLAAGELITTGTVTDAWSAVRGQRWRSDYGTLGLKAPILTIE